MKNLRREAKKKKTEDSEEREEVGKMDQKSEYGNLTMTFQTTYGKQIHL